MAAGAQEQGREQAVFQQQQERIITAVRAAWTERLRLVYRLRLALAGDDAPGDGIYDGTGIAKVRQWWHAYMRQLFNLL